MYVCVCVRVTQSWWDCRHTTLGRIDMATIVFLLVGASEMVVKITARAGRFFDNYWNCFDLFCVVYSLMSELFMFGGLRVHVTWWVIELFQVCTALLLALLARVCGGT